jgi:hypothetical protein
MFVYVGCMHVPTATSVTFTSAGGFRLECIECERIQTHQCLYGTKCRAYVEARTVYACVSTSTCICMNEIMCAYAYEHHAHDVHVHVCVLVCMCICMCIYAYTRMCVHVNASCVHTHMVAYTVMRKKRTCTRVRITSAYILYTFIHKVHS